MSRTLSAQHDRFALIRPFRIARGTRVAADVMTVTIREGAVAGRGEAVPYARYGETIEGSLAAIEQVRSLIEGGDGRDELAAALPPGAARNAVDCAFWDLEARLSGHSVAASLGWGAPSPLPTALTIGIDTPEAMAEAAARLGHVPVLKVKVDCGDPAAQLRAVRAAAPDPELIVDPNESWDRALLDRMQAVLLETRAALLEQPVPARDDACLEGFQPAIPICADESVHVAADLDIVARRYQAVNVKLDKTGGLTAALDLVQAARERGLGVMTGCMVSSSLSIAPALHLAAMSDYVDLDGPAWLREDRAGGVTIEGGILRPPESGFWGME